MSGVRGLGAALAAAMLLSVAPAGQAQAGPSVTQAARKLAVTIETRNGPKHFLVELARSYEQQERGLMFRTEIPADGGMLFLPYPPEGGPPREAQFWMKNTPSSLDILFIRADGTIAKIAADAVPFSEDHIVSGEPVAAVLEINAGRAAALGIAPGDKVSWAKPGK